MAQEFDIVQEVLAQFEESNDLVEDVLAELVAGGPVQGFSIGGSVDDPTPRGVGKNVDFGQLDVTTQGGGGPWPMVPVAGGKGSVNDQVNKQGIINAYIADLDNLGKGLDNLDTSVIDANAAATLANTSAADLLDSASSSTEAEFILNAKADQAGITDPDAKAAVVSAGITAFSAGKAGAEIVTATVDAATGYVKNAITGVIDFFKKVPGVIEIDPITGTVTSKHETQTGSSGGTSPNQKIVKIPGSNTTVTIGGVLGKILDVFKNGVDGEDILDVITKVIVATTGIPKVIVTPAVGAVIAVTENPCDDSVYAIQNPLECATIVTGDCSNPAYAAANPDICTKTCWDGSKIAVDADCPASKNMLGRITNSRKWRLSSL